ncbi:MAG TPA: DNA polymerase III subunit gamma/tau [Ktedonobacterales bacterium]|jgi:DNA polymerase-3 subunit gamma/tau|nr:DNA polymerase III subunit gamma/tau [Ktedonobacterales bacterium]
MASQSLYRKWRSQTFSDLIGQEAVTRTLLNAVRDGRLAHAYLFCGPRGTGKTSVARLLAKAINCQNPRDGEPCNECVSCLEVAAGRSPDVIEIDAASNNGVDDIRKIRENINLMGSGRYKVYIIDEAHMITPQAFNALLKTLEEPPPHIIFVFATTEAHKMLATVVSRCQRYDFRRIRMADIVARLQYVAQGEGLTLDSAAADLLARAAQGGLRDALSLLDQAVALCGNHVTVEGTRTMLGLADVAALRRIIACIAESRPAEALDLLNDLVTQGADLRQLNGQFAEEWRALMLARAGADLTRVMDYTEDEASELKSLAERFALNDLMASARVFARNEAPARGLPVPQLALELAVLECLGIQRHESPVALPTQPAMHAAMSAQNASQHASPQTTTPAPMTSAPATSATPMRQIHQAAPQPVQPPQVEELDLAAIDAGTWSGPTRPASQPSAPARPAPTVHSEPESSTAAEGDAPADAYGEELASGAGEDDGRDWVAEAQRNWQLIRKICRQKPPMGAVAGGFLSAADPVSVTPGDPPTLVIRTKFAAHLEKFRDAEMRSAVEYALEQALGVRFRTHFIGANEPQRGHAPAKKAANGASAPPNATVAQAAAPGPQIYERSATNGAQYTNDSRPVPAPEARAAKPLGPREESMPSYGRAEVREQPAPPAKPTADIERAAREDPVVQEFARMLKAEVVDVRPIGGRQSDGEA